MKKQAFSHAAGKGRRARIGANEIKKAPAGGAVKPTEASEKNYFAICMVLENLPCGVMRV